MVVHTIGTRYHKDGDAFTVRREPWWTYLIHQSIDLLCAATRHYFCNSKPMHWAIRLSDRHTEEYQIPASKEQLVAFERWRGWRDWDTEDDDDTDDED